MSNGSKTVTLNELIRLRSDYIYDIREGEKQLADKERLVNHLDNVIRIMAPHATLEALPRRRVRKTTSPYWERGQVRDHIYDTLRESKNGVVRPGEMATTGMRARGLNPENDHVVWKDFELRLRNAMFELRREGTFEKIGDERGAESRWRLTQKGREVLGSPHDDR